MGEQKTEPSGCCEGRKVQDAGFAKTLVLPKAQTYSWWLSGGCRAEERHVTVPADLHMLKASRSQAAHLTTLHLGHGWW